MSDLKPGMVLEGTVTNVAAFGAFVDIGVHQDGLVHISQLADRFVKDPHEVVKTGDVVKVTVTEVDIPRKRIALSMRKDGGASAREDQNARGPAKSQDRRPQGGKRPMQAAPKPRAASGGKSDTGNNALGAALRDAMRKK